MSALDYIQSTDRMTGRGHPTLPDTLNTALRQLLTESGYNPDADPFPGLMGPVFNVLAYAGGVTINTGVNDATAAIVAAEAARAAVNGTLVFPQGTYLLSTFTANTDTGSSALKINASGRWFGLGTVWLKYSNIAGTGEMVRVNSNPAAGAVSHVTIENIGFDGNGFQIQVGVGLRLMNATDCTVRGCRFKSFGYSGSGSFSYALRNEGYGTPANPYVWTSALPSGFSARNRILDNTFEDFQTGGGADSANAIFNYQVDGALIRGNVVRACGLGVMTYGPNRRVSVIGNEMEDGQDNGIRFEQDTVSPTDMQRNREHTVIGNVIRSMTTDGIRLNAYRITCKGNICTYNGGAGIKSDNSEGLLIDGNECHYNTNYGIALQQAGIAGQLSHAHATIVNNECSNNTGDGIRVIGGGADSLTPATAIIIRGNRCRFNSFQGITLQDADSKSCVEHNTCEQNGNGGVSFASGIAIVASLLTWGGARVAFNRCFDTTAAPNSKQPIGIWLRPTAGGVTLQRCYLYFNDCSDTNNSGSYFAAAVATNYAVTGTNEGHFLLGTLYRNVTRGVTRANIGQNLTANDIIQQVDEAGNISLTSPASSYIEGVEIADPAAPATNGGRFYFKDNGAGKTQFVVRFPTGAVQVIATEP